MKQEFDLETSKRHKWISFAEPKLEEKNNKACQ